SRLRLCCPAPKPPPCCSGRCSPQDRSPCARSTDGRPSPRNQTIRSLTSPHDRIALCHPKTRHPIPTQVATGPIPFLSKTPFNSPSAGAAFGFFIGFFSDNVLAGLQRFALTTFGT